MSDRRNRPPNRWGCKPTEDVCVEHTMPLVCRHGCEEVRRHACKDRDEARAEREGPGAAAQRCRMVTVTPDTDVECGKPGTHVHKSDRALFVCDACFNAMGHDPELQAEYSAIAKACAAREGGKK